MRRRLSIAFAAAALAVAVPGRGGMTLLSGPTVQDGRFRAEIAWEPRTDPAGMRRETVHFEGQELDLEGPAPNWALESALLALPGLGTLDTRQWIVGTDPATAPDAVELRAVRIGTIEALQVLGDGAKAAGVGRLKIVVEGPVAAWGEGQVGLDEDADVDADEDEERGGSSFIPHPSPFILPPSSFSLRPSPSALLSAFLNGAEMPPIPARSPEYRRGTVLPSPPGDVRISYTPGDTLLRVALADLGVAAGEVAALRLDHHGDALPVAASDASHLWVFAPRRHTAWDRTDALFATAAAGAPSPAIAFRPAFASLAPAGTEAAIARSRTFDGNTHYERLLYKPIGERFVFHRAGYPVPGNMAYLDSYTMLLPVWDRLTSTTISLTADLYGYNQWPVTPDHYADFTVEGVALPRVSWEGRTRHLATMAFDLAAIPTGTHLSVTHRVPDDSPVVTAPTSGADQQNLDVLTLEWTGFPRADNTGAARLELPADIAPRRVTVGGFPPGATSADILVLDVTDPAAPVRVTGAPVFADSDGGMAVEFEAPANACAFALQLLAAAPGPETVAPAETLPALLPPGETLRAIYVRPSVLAAEADVLVAHRGPEGILLLDPQAAYNAYSGGQESPEAVREALAALLGAAPAREALPEVLLIGHASLDHHNHMGVQTAAQIPTFIDESVPTGQGTIENPVDFPYAALEGSDDFVDVRLGRIPARTPSDAARAIARIIRHDDILETLRLQERPALFVADDEEPFLSDNEAFAIRWGFSGHSGTAIGIIPGPSPDLVTAAAIKGALEAPGGLAYLMYTGHGNIDVWAGEAVMTSAAVPGIVTADQWPIVATFTCLNGYYAFPGSSVLSLSEAWLFASDNGAVANIAPVGVDFYSEQRYLALELLDLVGLPEASRPRKIGEAFAAAQLSYAAEAPGFIGTLREYILFGDPRTDLTLDEPAASRVTGWQAW